MMLMQHTIIESPNEWLDREAKELSRKKGGKFIDGLDALAFECGSRPELGYDECVTALKWAAGKSGVNETQATIDRRIAKGLKDGGKEPPPASAKPNGSYQRGTIETQKASEIPARAIRWLWKDRFALGKLGLIGGLPDKGKGLFTCDFMACVTNNHPLPCNEGHTPQGSVILLTAEDDYADTVIPRLKAAGADLDRVHIVKMYHEGAGKQRTFSLLTDLEALRKRIEEIPDTLCIIIDPMSAYLGVGKVNNNMTSDVRGFLKPLTDLAAEKLVLVLGVMHFNKKVDVTNAMLRIADSLAYSAAARHVYAVVDDPDVENRRLFVKAKNNSTGPAKKTLSYMTGSRMIGHDPETKEEIWAPHIEWGADYVEISASEAMQAEAGGNKGRAERREAKDFLLDRLDAGPVRQTELFEEGEAAGLSKSTLQRAKKDLNIKSVKGKGLDNAWTWELLQ